jgi:hypothetical protein
MFTFISNIYDISAQLNNAPLYYKRFLIVDDAIENIIELETNIRDFFQ